MCGKGKMKEKMSAIGIFGLESFTYWISLMVPKTSCSISYI